MGELKSGVKFRMKIKPYLYMFGSAIVIYIFFDTWLERLGGLFVYGIGITHARYIREKKN